MEQWIRAGLACALACVATAAQAAGAWVEGADDAGDARVEARIVVHPSARDDTRLLAGVQLRLDPGWHLYWRNPGDSGIPTEVTWRDAEASALQWPAPHAFEEADGELVTFGYDGEVLLASWLRPALGAESLGADVSLLVCRASCIPAELSLSAPREPDAASLAEVIALFSAHEAALPVTPASFGVRVSAATREGGATLTVHACEAGAACRSLAPPMEGPAFFSELEGDTALHEESAIESGDGLTIALMSEGAALPARIRGVIALRDEDGAPRHLEVDAPLDGVAASASASVAAVARTAGAADPGIDPAQLLAMLGLALLGGLVLNLMPCVLPVLALKVFAVSELASQSRGEALRHGAAYAAGVLLSMLALAGAAILLREAGHAVGWGFQFQEPAYVAVISVVLVAFALNLFGVFEIGFQPGFASAGADAPGARRSFFEGLLAVALATPCSAPFLGTALGFAFASPPLVIALVFLAVGAGLAAPFVVISAFPALGRFLPRSGAWMGTLRSGLGFALLASTLWLLWIFGRSAGADAIVALLGILLAGSFIAWLYGRAQHAGARFAGALALAAASALAIGGANFVGVSTPGTGAAPPRDAAAPNAAHGEAWSEAAVDDALAAGRPVFAYFTADWCLTCKLNERIGIDTERTRAQLRAGGFAVLRGDWTQRDEAIRRELARHGKAGVPLYLVYTPGAPDSPRVLPELLTPDLLANALAAATAPRQE
jgi:thiol:disulfide interchange protein DsbD